MKKPNDIYHNPTDDIFLSNIYIYIYLHSSPTRNKDVHFTLSYIQIIIKIIMSFLYFLK